ncbi:MAG: glycosyltransferase family 39 protein [Rhodospirillaceae bacterium]|nr:glycosyltransferase family 39 protein [Rhodospirillales bacterium]
MLCAIFLTLQAATMDYGTSLNNHPTVSGAVSRPPPAGALDRQTVIGQSTEQETPARWSMRFRLYSVEADEMMNVMALARMRPAELSFDPHYYQYGGAYLYPLGGWLFALQKTGVLRLGSLDDMLADPDRMDRVYGAGRLFVTLAFAASGLILWATLRRLGVAPRRAALALAIYLAAPASLYFSSVMKPHWYSLLWSNLALYCMVRLNHEASWRWLIGLGVALGLTVGSVLTNGVFALLAGAGLLALVWRRRLPVWALVAVVVLAGAVAAAFNPYMLLNWTAFRAEAEIGAGWFNQAPTAALLWDFVAHSLVSGFGVALPVAVIAVIVTQRWGLAAAGLAFPIVVIGSITAAIATWHDNARYVPYWLSLAVLVLAMNKGRASGAILAVTCALTLVQAVPTKMAQADTDSPAHSTRLRAAAWVEANVPHGSALCLGTRSPAPFDAPPLAFADYRINDPQCRFMVVTERDPTDAVPDGWSVAARFSPRLGLTVPVQTVFGHTNPRISIYEHSGS